MLTEYPLRTIVENPEANGRIAMWVTEIRCFRVPFESRTSIKGQILADFIAEFTLGSPPQSILLKAWILNVDGGSHGKGVGVGIILTTPEGSIIEQSYTLGFEPPTTRPSMKQSLQASRWRLLSGPRSLKFSAIHYS